MSAGGGATREDRDEIRRLVLEAIGEGAAFPEVAGRVAAGERSTFPFPADVFTEAAADAFELAGVSRSKPVSLEDLAGRYLPECEFRGNTDHQKARTARNLVVDLHAGVIPDYLGDAGWWMHQNLWWFSLATLIMAIRLVAEVTGEPVAAICAQLSAGEQPH